MSPDPRDDVFDEAPETDVLEQRTPVSAEEAADDTPVDLLEHPDEADPADLWEQANPLPDDDDDYGHGPADE